MRLIILALLISASCQGQRTYTISTVPGQGASTSTGVSLKSLGIVSDADVRMFSSTFGTDQTAAIQAILNTNPVIDWDVKISTTGLTWRSGSVWNPRPGCGAILRDGSNKPLLRNENWAAGNNNIVDSSFTLNGGIWNGNGWRGEINRQVNNNATYGQITVVSFFGVKNVVLNNAQFINSSSWHVLFLTSENVTIQNCIIDCGPLGHKIQDGIDFIGKAQHIRLLNNRIRNGDDKIVFCPNATGGILNQGAGGIYDHTAYTGVDGDIFDVTCDGNYFDKQGKGFAFYSAGGNDLMDINISNTSGFSETNWFGLYNKDILAGYTLTTGSKIPKRINVVNSAVQVYQYIGYGSTSFPNIAISCSVENINFDGVTRFDYAMDNPTINIYNAAGGNTTPIVVTNLSFNNYRTTNSSPSGYPNHINIASNMTVNGFDIINSKVNIGSEAITRAVIYNAGTINGLIIPNARVNNLRYLLNNVGTINGLNSYGINHTGQSVNDATFLNSGTITLPVISNWNGKLLSTGITGVKGDATL